MEIIKAGEWRAALIILIFLSAGYGVAAITNHTSDLYYDNYVATYWVNSTSTKSTNYYLGATSLNARLGGDYGTLDITTTGDVEGTNVNATTFYQDGTSLNDLISGAVTGVNVTESSYIIWEDNGTYYAQDGMTGVVTSNADAATLLQARFDAGGEIYIKNGVYEIATQLNITKPVKIRGESAVYDTTTGYYGTILNATNSITSIINIDISEAGSFLQMFKISDIILDGDDKADYGMCLTSATCITLEDVWAVNCEIWGFHFKFNCIATLIHCATRDCGANGTPISGGLCIGDTTGATAYNSISDVGGDYSQNDGCGVYIHGGVGYSFSGTVIEGNYAYGLFAEGGQSAVFSGCDFELNNQHGLAVPANQVDTWAQNYVFQGCAFIETHAGTTLCLNILGSRNIVSGCEYDTTKIYIAPAQDNIYIGRTALLSTGTYGQNGGVITIINSGPTGWAATTPNIGATTVGVINPNPYPCLVHITSVGGGVTAVGITDSSGTLVTFTKTVAVGDAYHVDVNGKIALTYSADAPTWDFYGL